MKAITKFLVFLFAVIGVASCYPSIPLENKPSQNNSTYNVSYLFEQDGQKIYRFYDRGNYVYFTTRGDVTAIKNDSTKQRVVTVYTDSLSMRKMR